MLGLLAIGAAGDAQAAVCDGLSPLAHSFCVDGVERQANGDWRAAMLRFEKVTELEPTYTPAWCRLGDVLAEEDGLEAALQAWKQAPYDADCLEARGRAYLELGRYADALTAFQQLQKATAFEPFTDLLLARAHLGLDDRIRAERALDLYLDRNVEEPSPELLVLVEDLVTAWADDAEHALALIDRTVTAQPQLESSLSEVRAAFRIDVRARELMGAAPVALNAAQRARLEEARRAFGNGDVATAKATLDGLRDEVTRNPEVWAALADAREAEGDIAGADYALQVARMLSPQRSAYHARYGQILATHYGGRFDREALAAFERALEGGPDPDLTWCRAEVARRIQRFGAVRDALATLAQDHPDWRPEGSMCALPSDPAVLLADLERVRPDAPSIPAVDSPAGVDPDAWLGLHRAQAYLDAGEPQRALDEIDGALALEPELVEALNFAGQLHTQRGDHAAAMAAYERSLAVDPEQGNVMAALAERYRLAGRPEEARAMRVRAAEAKSPVARFLLAQEAASDWRWWEARSYLDGYFEVASSGALYTEATALRAHVDRRIRDVWLGSAAAVTGGLALFVGVPVMALARRRSGKPLSALLDRHPKTFREVARIVSAIRHEVLKHNISALPGVAESLERGEVEPAMWAAERLFGRGGAVARFRRYIDELEELGRLHRVALNLRHRDPVFGPLIAAMDRLVGLKAQLESGRARAADVEAISDALNDEGYRALGRVLDGVCVVQLTRDVFDAALDDVLTEPAFRGRPRPDGEDWGVDIPQPAPSVRVFRGDLHDILVNLLRNALQASDEAGVHRLGVRLDFEEDWITGLRRVEIRVGDDAPRRISTAMIRGRYIDRGLGLAVDLTSRAGGSIHVEDEPGFEKAVVVKLPIEEGEG
jgi:tetratricopeptide (TPR) repeat protein